MKIRKSTFLSYAFIGLLGVFTALSFTSCSDDDDNEATKSLSDVEGGYMGTVTIGTLDPAVVTASVEDGKIKLQNFPVSALVTAIVGEQMAPAIIPLVGAVSYDMAYTAAFSANESSINLTLDAQPLTINIASLGQTVVANILATPAVYSYDTQKLNFTLTVTSVTVNGADFPFASTGFVFEFTSSDDGDFSLNF